MPRALTTTTIAALLLCSSVPAHAQNLVRGPYVQWPTTTSITVVWDQDAAGAAEVRYGASAASLTQIAASPSVKHHEVKLTGLQPGQTYHYAVYQGGTKLPQTASTFPTAVKSATPFRFLLFGDTRSDFVTHQKQIAAMVNEPKVRFFINTGDLVASGEIQADWNDFFKAEAPLIRRVPLYPVLGNHDEEGGKYALYAKHMVINGSSPDPEAYYAFSYGNARFVVLDGHVNVEPWYVCLLAGKLYDGCFKQKQVDWLTKELQTAAAAPTIQHIFVLVHMGPYTSKPGRTGYQQMRDLLPLFKTHGVRAIFSGHDHYYERGLAGNGIPYVITGGGGASLYTIGAPSFDPHTVIKAQSVYHYNVIDIDGPQVTVTVKSLPGKVIDQYTLGSAPPDAGVAPADAGPPPADLKADTLPRDAGAPPQDSAADTRVDAPGAATDSALQADSAAAAGDTTPANSGDSGSCSVGADGGAPWPGLLCLGFALLLTRRRRHRG